MTLNFPGPFQVRLYYTVASRPHVQNLNCDETTGNAPGLAMSSYRLEKRDTTDEQANVLIDAWVALIDNMFTAAFVNFTHAELWKYTPGTNDAQFYAVHTIGVAGTNAGAVNTAGQARMSFITQEGGTMFLDFMETIHAIAVTDPYPFANADVQAIANFVISTSNWIKARDTSYPIAARNWLSGQNEALAKKIYRP